MARLPRLIIEGLPHIVSQRVQHEQTLARDTVDRMSLLELLRTMSREHAVAIHAYALLDGRFDLVVTPTSAAGLSRFMQAVARRHSADFNRRHGRSGGLWSGRYRVAVIDAESWLLTCMRYVEQSVQRLPTEASAAALADPAPVVSSQPHHAGANVEAWMHDLAPYWALGNTPFERQASYRALVARPVTEEEATRIEAALRGGWALGPAGFTDRAGSTVVRPVAPRAPGRPRREEPLVQSVPKKVS